MLPFLYNMERTQEYITLEYSLILFCIAEKDWLDGVVALEAGQKMLQEIRFM